MGSQLRSFLQRNILTTTLKCCSSTTNSKYKMLIQIIQMKVQKKKKSYTNHGISSSITVSPYFACFHKSFPINSEVLKNNDFIQCYAQFCLVPHVRGPQQTYEDLSQVCTPFPHHLKHAKTMVYIPRRSTHSFADLQKPNKN